MTRYLPGDIIERRKGVVMHKGIVLRDGRVLHNTPFRGEHVTTQEDFLRGKRMYVRRMERIDRHRALHAAENAGRRDYNLLTNNCEHTVTRATTGRADSPQLRSWAAGIGLAALALVVTRHPGIAAAGYAVGRGLVKGSLDSDRRSRRR